MREVAIVGMSCRLPGGLDDVTLLWDALCKGRNTADTVPSDRWSADWFYSSVEASPGKAYVSRGNFLKQNVQEMDASFFDIPPRVAENLDPQQRLMLEVVWEAFENSGISLPGLAGEKVGVYVGGFMLDHMITHMHPENAALINQNTAAGMMMTMLSNRISHAFDLRGPSLSIDTACSSSLTAFNYGCRDILSGACDVAAVGGVNIMTRPEYPVGMSKGQFLARDGECKSFDERGDGYGRGEGAGVIVLKEMSQAIRDGDVILAKVLATGVNSDGRTPGISMPSGEAQEALARELCEENNIDPGSIHYVECHGTGTSIGDPTEAGSIGNVYGKNRTGDDRVVIGTIKSNIGHTEALAGIAGVIKAVMTLVNRVATPLANLQTPNSSIPFDDLGLRLSDEMVPLGKGGETLRAAVNSFGYGGTNAHAILEGVSAPEKVLESSSRRHSDMPLMLPISARSTKALKELAGKVATSIETGNGTLEDIIHTAAHRRAHLSHRAVVMGDDALSLTRSLKNFSEGEEETRVVSDNVPFGGLDKPVFVYTGMGPQWWGMGQELYRENDQFRQALDEADGIFKRISGFSILQEMLKDEKSSEISKTEYAQPANFLIQYGITRLLETAGVVPGAIVGHSVGEVGSAYASGALTLEDALLVSYHRSRTQAKTAGTGSMLAIGLSEAMLTPYLDKFSGKIDVAAINGPSTITVSGDSVSIQALATDLTEAEVFNRVLTVEVPYHSYLMDSITDELIESLESVSPAVPERLLFSTVTGQQVNDIAFDGQYWAHNVRQPVAFMEAMKNLTEMGFSTFVEIGPHPVLSSSIRDCARTFGKDVRLVETLRRGTEKRPSRPELEAIYAAVAGVYASGAHIDWQIHAPTGNLTRLPNYPWQRELHWLESTLGGIDRTKTTTAPLLGYSKTAASTIWRNDLTHDSVAYLYDHVVTGTVVMPGAGYIEMMLELGHALHDEVSGIDVRDISIASPLVLDRARSLEILTQYDPTTSEVQIRSSECGQVQQHQLHVTAEVGRIDSNLVQLHDIDQLKAKFEQPSDATDLYGKLTTMGLQYGEAFQPIQDLYLSPESGEALARLSLREDLRNSEGYFLHPVLLDGCFQMLMGVLRDTGTMYLPTGFDSIRVLTTSTPNEIWCYGRVISQSARNIVTELTLLDENGYTVAEVRGMQATAASGGSSRKRIDKWGDEVNLEEAGYNWFVGEAVDEPIRLGRWLVMAAEGEEIAPKVLQQLESMGAMQPVLVGFGDDYQFSDEEATIRCGSDEDAARLLKDIGDIHGIAFMNGLVAGNESDPTGEVAIEAILAMTKAVAAMPDGERPRTYYITQNAYVADAVELNVRPAQTAIGAFMRVAHNEIEYAKASLIDLPRRINDQLIVDVVAEMLADADEDEVAFRGGRRMVSVLQLTDKATKPTCESRLIANDTLYRVRPAVGDDSDGMVALQEMHLANPGADDIRIRVTDMSIPNSLLVDPNRSTLDQSFVAVVGEVEFAGAQVNDLSIGERVYGYVPADFASHIQASRAQCHIALLSDGVESGDALTALDTLVVAKYAAVSADLDEGDRVLIMENDAMAAAIGAELRKQGVEIYALTGEAESLHQAVDLAVADNSGQRFDAVVAPMSLWMSAVGAECLCDGGKIIDSSAQAQTVRVPSSLSGMVRCDLTVAAGRPKRLKDALESTASALAGDEKLENAGIAVGLFEVTRQTFDIPHTEIRIDINFNTVGNEVPVQVELPIAFDSEATYLVTGGLGGFGMKTASWLVAHGAKALVLASRSGANTPEKQAYIDHLTSMGVRVEAPQYDLSDRQAVENMIAWIEKELPPLKGIYHSAAVIEDHNIVDLEPEVLRRVMRAKATSAWALHEASNHIELDQFVCYSSIASVVGNRRQAAYSAANGYLSGLVYHRRSQGQHGLSIVWGAIGDVGVVAESKSTEEFLKYIGIRGLPSAEALDRMAVYVARDITEISCALMAGWGNWARYETIGSKSPRFVEMMIDTGDSGQSEARAQLVEELEPLDQGERLEVLTGLISAVVANELRQDADSLSIDRPINDLGVDSLMATEIQLLLASNLGLSISVMDLLGGATIRALAEKSLIDIGLAEDDAQASLEAVAQ